MDHLRDEISRLDAVFKTAPDEQVQKQLEYLNSYITGYKNIKRTLKLKELALSAKWDDLDTFNVVDGQNERAQLANSYGQLIKLLNVNEETTYKIIAAPPGWFATTIAEWENWVKQNPDLAFAGVACGCAALAAVGALVGTVRDLTACGFSCKSAGVAAHALMGAGVGLALGVAVVLALAAMYGAYTCYKEDEQTKTDIQKIDDMVQALKKMPESDFAKQMDSIIEKCKDVSMAIPSQQDWMCLVCLAEGDEVKEPVKARGCTKNHVLCKACWEEHIKTPAGCEGKCMLCFR